MKFWAILPAAGVGRRLGSITPKQYLPLLGSPIIEHSIRRLLALADLERLVVAINPEDEGWKNIENRMRFDDRLETVSGGLERQDSVLSGLHYLSDRADADDWVLVHDAVRPCISIEDISKLVNSLKDDPVGGILATPIASTIKRVIDGVIVQTVNREELWQAETPQMFRFGKLLQALESAEQSGVLVTDEAGAVERLGESVRIVPGSGNNLKITHEGDLELAALILARQQEQAEERSPAESASTVSAANGGAK
jgi:2-C-methyl-D-erythritol 4-phosphate cytidylyltransferase